jgi:hypothetical protein
MRSMIFREAGMTKDSTQPFVTSARCGDGDASRLMSSGVLPPALQPSPRWDAYRSSPPRHAAISGPLPLRIGRHSGVDGISCS